tara:strand:- start:588 stop:689 length:102 start_codon:yes stop_codon:yes gene_type:complete
MVACLFFVKGFVVDFITGVATDVARKTSIKKGG